MLRKIVKQVPEDVLQQDLEGYRKNALKLGATDAKVITSDDIVVEERVIAKCLYPKCPVSGTNINCPPYTPDIEHVRRMVKEYRYAIFFKLDGPYEPMVGGGRDEKLKCFEILAKVESQAYYDGYYLSVGFGGSSCKTALCPDEECSAITPGKACRHPLRGRPSLHAMGMDAFKMAVNAGWEVYPVGKATLPSEVPFISHFGIILIY